METEIGTDINLAAKLLNAGNAVAIPTETVYGLAANALDPDAVLKIFKAKNRPQFNPLIIHLPNWESVKKYVTEIPADAAILAEKFSPGPLTFLLEKKKPNSNLSSFTPHSSPLIPDLVTAGSPKVAVRIPAHPLTRALLAHLDFPVAAPSANPFGYVSPTTAQHVFEGLNGKIPYILDGGPCQIGLESTIVDFDNQQVIVRRQGGVAVEAIEEALGKKVLVQTGVEEHPVAPGQLKSHYATATPLYVEWTEELLARFDNKKIAMIAFGKNMDGVQADFHFQLSAFANFDEAAKNLFSTMREADACGADVILSKFLPETGLGQAINDRLRRAACTT
ncbi:MAG: threonylcarbamoyl-AMP synthase [Saprospiraceae bacterium]|nr:threonylcarbamoyl-AMP synthase [Saprospiraceae bacterium]MCF8248511.1 threonylcarbamoyl-AMP synthase [Saprospiraceae bacterium]MCF8280582.1 threonylcarbamoyl-AMP synthase [Bacteroidales bacterium]MCF8310245.1 threonylcarbamoyl-AMP synthase [Saprospiraceae bacterium]MCF8439316.1 threonylcarbamoyl-AMP synthase [Saprospiraceae bacterium]